MSIITNITGAIASGYGTTPGINASNIGASRPYPRDMDGIRVGDLESLPFNTPIEVLVNLWVTRYGNEWVDIDVVMREEFYALTYKRLRATGHLEQHFLTDRSNFVCRKPE